MLSDPSGPGSPEDRALLVERVAELERAQREEDVEGFLALFEPGAVWVTGGGKRLIGLESIAAFTRQVLPGAMKDASVSYEVVNITFIRHDVAITNVHQQYLYLDGNPQPGMTGAPSYVWSKTNGSWRIVAGQNTTVLPD